MEGVKFHSSDIFCNVISSLVAVFELRRASSRFLAHPLPLLPPHRPIPKSV